MTLDAFFQLGQEDLLLGLEPYQQELIKDLLSKNSYLNAVDLWLQASPSQTAEFGGDPDKSKSKVYRDKLVEEIEKFVCGTDVSYEEDRNKILEQKDASQQYIIGVLSSAIGSKFGVVGTFIAPVIVILIMSFEKMSIKAWCEYRKTIRNTGEIHTF